MEAKNLTLSQVSDGSNFWADVLSELIVGGHWNELIKQYTLNHNKIKFHQTLKLAYVQKKINLDELATAYIFLAPAVHNEPYEVMSFEKAKEEFGDNYYSFFPGRWTERVLESIPESQRYFIVVNGRYRNSDEFTPYGLFNEDRSARCAGGIATSKSLPIRDNRFGECVKMGFSSACLLQADVLAEGHLPLWMIGLTETRKNMFEHILQGLSDFALIDENDVFFHGGIAYGITPYLHDGFHTANRVRTKLTTDSKLVDACIKLQEMLDELPPYTLGLINKNTIYLSFHKNVQRTQNDYLRFILDYALTLVADGEHSYKENHAETLVDVINRAFNALERCSIDIDRPQYNKQLIELLRPILFDHGIKFNTFNHGERIYHRADVI